MAIKRADGNNKSEQYLKRICDKTFLSLWSYSNIYSNEGLLKNGQGEEVCDLLVIFDNHIIIFSDKDCEFPNSGNIEIDWKRWYKKSIKKSVQQLLGAEKQIKKYPECLFLDNRCTQKLPIDIPSIEFAQFHLIAVAHNSSERCCQELGGSGNLKINTFKPTYSDFSENAESPFYIGDINKNNTFIHVLDDISLEILMQTLDTVSDFVNYLTKKEQLFRSSIQISAASELEILAYYHEFRNDKQELDFKIFYDPEQQANELILKEGGWIEFENSPKRKAKLEADKISYVWDKLIEKFNYHTLQENLYWGSHLGIAEEEKLIRFFAKENRFHRRVLSKCFYELINSAPIDSISTRYLPFSSIDSEKLCYVFMVFPHFNDLKTYKDYREVRQAILFNYCHIAKLRFPESKHILGIATEPKVLGKEGRSEDYIYVDVTQWSSESEKKVKQIDDENKIIDRKFFKRFHWEYPPQ